MQIKYHIYIYIFHVYRGIKSVCCALVFFPNRVRERRPNVILTLTYAPTQAKEPNRVLEKLRKHVLATSKSNHIFGT